MIHVKTEQFLSDKHQIYVYLLTCNGYLILFKIHLKSCGKYKHFIFLILVWIYSMIQCMPLMGQFHAKTSGLKSHGFVPFSIECYEQIISIIIISHLFFYSCINKQENNLPIFCCTNLMETKFDKF